MDLRAAHLLLDRHTKLDVPYNGFCRQFREQKECCDPYFTKNLYRGGLSTPTFYRDEQIRVSKNSTSQFRNTSNIGLISVATRGTITVIFADLSKLKAWKSIKFKT